MNDYQKFLNEYWNEFKFSKNKIELLKIWFVSVKQDLSDELYKSYFDKDWFYWYLNIKNNSNIVNNKFLFKNKLWIKLFNKFWDELLKIWYSNFIDEINWKFKEIFEKFWLKEYLNSRWKNEKEILEYKSYISFSNEFWKKFTMLSNKWELLKIWFDNVIKEINWEYKRIYELWWFNLYLISKNYYSNKNDLILEISFKNEFWKEFSILDDKEKWKLLKLNLNEVKNDILNDYKEIYNEEWLSWYLRFKWKIVSLKNYLNEKKFKRFFWRNFSNLSLNKRNKLLRIWFEEVKKDMWRHNILNDISNYLYLKDFDNEELDSIEKETIIQKISWIQMFRINNLFKWILMKSELKDVKYWSNFEFNSWINSVYWLVLNKLWFDINKIWEIKFNCWHSFNLSHQILSRISKWVSDVCIKCNPHIRSSSYKERELSDFIKSIYKWEVLNNQKILEIFEEWKKKQRKEIDIYLPSLNLWFEFNWIYWHNDDKSWSYKKYYQAKKQWIRLITIWEDIWFNKKEIIKNEIKKLLIETNISLKDIKIKKIDKDSKNNFLEKFHIHWKENSKNNVWAFYWEELVWVISINSKWEITRFSTKYNINWLLNKFIEFIDLNYEYEHLIIEISNEFNNWDVFKESWFIKQNDISVDYCYVNNNFERFNKFENKKEYCYNIYDCWWEKFIYKK